MSLTSIPSIKGIADVEVSGRRVLMRVDFDVPLDKGRIADDTRIRSALPTIEHVVEQGGRLVLMSHLGRPNGRPNEALSLEPVAGRLAELLKCGEVTLTDSCVGDGARRVVLECRDGQVILLENLRFHEGEIRNDDKFAKQLASMGEIYVNEAFATTHRGYASNVGVVKYLHTKAAGFLLAKELASLGRLMGDVRRPYVAVLGGAKASDKFDVIESLLQRVDTFVMGGAVANTFIAATGGDVGASLVEEDKLPIARNLLARAEIQGVRILLPRDFVVADSQEATQTETAQADQVPQGMMVLDIGPESRARYKEALSRAATVFWNGPMGVFEKAAFAEGTLAVAKAIAGTAAFSVVGGDDTAAAVHRFGLERGFDHISEGDGASLKMIEGKTLPGIVALA